MLLPYWRPVPKTAGHGSHKIALHRAKGQLHNIIKQEFDLNDPLTYVNGTFDTKGGGTEVTKLFFNSGRICISPFACATHVNGQAPRHYRAETKRTKTQGELCDLLRFWSAGSFCGCGNIVSRSMCGGTCFCDLRRFVLSHRLLFVPEEAMNFVTSVAFSLFQKRP